MEVPVTARWGRPPAGVAARRGGATRCGGEGSPAPAPGRRAGGGPRLASTDAWLLAALAAVPALLLALPAAAGYPLMTGDAVVQNYPLRVLAGEAIAHGHLPLYDPYLFGGSPLLGGINAGAAFPDVVLFGLLPHLAAWVAVESLAFAGAACGLYLFLRANRLGPLPAVLGAATYGLGGFLSSQAVHLDVVETGACLAWALLALERLAHAPARARPAWAALLLAATGCTALAGSPEAAFDASCAIAAYAVHLLWRAERPGRLAGWLLAGVAGGALLGAVQITTGAAAVAASQRGHVGLQFLTSGTVARSLVLLLAPHVLGGGPVGLEPYVGTYNLAELDAYTGIVALSGTAFLAAAWRRRGASRWRVFHAIAVIGLAIAASGRIGLARLLADLPVIGESRLPSRALLLWSLATSVLLAYFCAELLEPGSVSPEPGVGAWARRRARTPPAAPAVTPAAVPARAAALAAPLAVLALVAALAVGGRSVAGVLAQRDPGPWSRAAVAPYLACCGLLAAGAAVLVLLPARSPSRLRQRLLVALVVADLLLFTADQSSFAPVRSPAVAASSPLATALAARLGPGGRFLVVDPSRSGGEVLDELGAPDLDVLHRLASAQGYASLVWAPYQSATGTHGQDVVAARALGGGAFDALDVRALLVVPGDFLRAVRRPPAPGALVLAPGRSATRYFGGTPALDAIEVRAKAAVAGATAPGATARALAALARSARLLPATGGALPVRFEARRAGSTLLLRLRRPVDAGGLVLGLPPRVAALRLSVTLVTASGRLLALDGPLSADATAPHWRPAGSLGPYAVLTDTRAVVPLRLEPLDGERADGSSLRVLSQSPWTGALRVLVEARAPLRLVRSVADIPGWAATLTEGGRTRPLRVRRDGVVQQVSLPRGRDVVTITYTAPGLAAGEAGSLAGALLLIVLAAWGAGARRADRRAKGGDGSGVGGVV